MLKKHYPLAIIGKSYLSFIYGIELLRYSDSILILDDDRLSFGDLYETGLGQIDYSFLQVFGVEHGIEVLERARPLRLRPYFFYCDGVRFYLGRDPWSNLRELYRKLERLFPFGFLFDSPSPSPSFGEISPLEKQAHALSWNEKSFNNDYRVFCDRLGLKIFRLKDLENLDNLNSEYMRDQCPEGIILLFKIFSQQISKNSSLEKAFLYYARSLFHKTLSTSFSELELFHFFICLIGPHYDLETSSLLKCLEEKFSTEGGDFKKTHVREWKFYKQRPWSIELSSFEGIIHPQRMTFLGTSPSTGFPLKMLHKGYPYQSIHFRIPFRGGDRDFLPEESWVFIGHHRSMGTDFPFLKMSFSQEEGEEPQIKGQILYREKRGTKLSFYEKKMRRILLLELHSLFPQFFPSLEPSDEASEKSGEELGDASKERREIEFFKGRELYLERAGPSSSGEMLSTDHIELYDFSTPDNQLKLKNVSYFGPLKGGRLGTLGQLLEIRHRAKFHPF